MVKTIIVALILLMAISVPAVGEEFTFAIDPIEYTFNPNPVLHSFEDNFDAELELVNIVLTVADLDYTRRAGAFFRYHDFDFEANPFLGPRPSDEEIVRGFVLWTICRWGISKVLPEKWRKVFNLLVAGESLYSVYGWANNPYWQ